MTTTTELMPSYLDVTGLAVGSFLARYREPTLTAYTQDLRAFLGWCQAFEREPLRVTRGELEMYVRHWRAADTPRPRCPPAGSAPSRRSTSAVIVAAFWPTPPRP